MNKLRCAVGMVVALAVASVLAVQADEPRVVMPDRSTQAVPVLKEQSRESPFAIVDGELRLRLPDGPVLVVAASEEDVDLVYGAQLLENVRSEQDLIDTALDLQKRFPAPARLGSPDGGPFLDLGNEPTYVVTPNATHVAFATFRKICPAGCAPWPEDPACCRILGCSGAYTDCIIIRLSAPLVDPVPGS